MPRFNDAEPYTPDYEETCARCEREFDRGELAWEGDALVCSTCETPNTVKVAA